MKYTYNMTTSREDLERYADEADFCRQLRGFDGVELMVFGEDERHVLPEGSVLGLHMNCRAGWLDFWNRDEAALIREYDDLDTCRAQFGGTLDPQRLVEEFRRDHALAKRFGAEYMVYHLSDCTLEETFTQRFRHRDEEVIDAAAAIINEATAGSDGGVLLLLENLWLPGLTFTRPEMTRRLLEKVSYPNVGLMLDTGHLLHTNWALRSQREGVAYISRLLDEHGDLCRYIRGVHLNQSLTGDYCRKTAENPPRMAETYAARSTQMFYHAFAVDRHQPFTAPGIRELLDRIGPDYCTFEFITENRRQHDAFLRTQRRALGLPLFE